MKWLLAGIGLILLSCTVILAQETNKPGATPKAPVPAVIAADTPLNMASFELSSLPA